MDTSQFSIQIILRSAQKLVHILSAKCLVLLGLLQIDYVKLFFNDPFVIEFFCTAAQSQSGVPFQSLKGFWRKFTI